MPAKSVSSPEVVTVQSDAQATALLQAWLANELDPFLAGPRSPSDLAGETGRSIMQVMRWLERLQRLGLVEVKQVLPRAGRAIRLYGPTASAFYIPLHILPLDEALHLFNQNMQQQTMQDLTAALRHQAGVTGVRVSLTRQSILLMRSRDELLDNSLPDFPAVADAWTTLQLDYADACTLRDEMTELVKKYAGRGGASAYAVHWLMTPQR